MVLTKYKLGELITQRREKNDGSDLPICGVSKDGLIPPKQKDADTSIYNVFYRDDFVFNPARMELNSIAINDMYDRAICSSLYEVFYVHRTDLLLPHYLKLIIRQKWFTRYCEFLGQGSAREYCRFGNICEIEVEFPPIKEQQKMIDYNTAIENRIALKQRINDNLDSQISTLYKEYFPSRIQDEIPNGWEFKTVQECGFDISDGNYSSKYPKYNEFVPDGIPFIRGTDFTGKYISIQNALFITPEMHAALKKGHTKRGDILMSTRGEIGKVAFVPDTLIDANINSQLVRINANGVLPRVYMAYSFLSETVRNEIKSLITGSVQEQLPIGKLQKVHILFPDSKTLDKFCNAANPLLNNILENEHEVVLLTQLQAVMLETLSSH